LEFYISKKGKGLRYLDRVIQSSRIKYIKKYISKGSYILDIGCHQGELFTQLGGLISGGIGIDPLLSKKIVKENVTLLPGYFPIDFTEIREGLFDCILALALFEHIPIKEQKIFVESCVKLLRPNGKIILTIPSPRVDLVLDILIKLNLLDGMSVEEHFGFNPDMLVDIFNITEMELIVHKKFQMGLNNCFVFLKN